MRTRLSLSLAGVCVRACMQCACGCWILRRLHHHHFHSTHTHSHTHNACTAHALYSNGVMRHLLRVNSHNRCRFWIRFSYALLTAQTYGLQHFSHTGLATRAPVAYAPSRRPRFGYEWAVLLSYCCWYCSIKYSMVLQCDCHASTMHLAGIRIAGYIRMTWAWRYDFSAYEHIAYNCIWFEMKMN